MSIKHTYEEVKSYIESQGYHLLSSEYRNNRKKLEIKCPHNHTFKMNYYCFYKRGQRCPECAKKIYGQYHKLDYNYVYDFCKNINYLLISKYYVNAHKKLRIKCDKEHIFEMNYANLYSGKRCPICYYKSSSSKPEREIQKFIKSIYYGKILPNSRDVIVNPNTGYNLELDVYLPEINKAIEFNGIY